jgi:FixJ family two-component response regulator
MSEPLNVLIIDDDEQLRNLLVHIVTRMGHVAVAAASAEAGLELLPFWTFQIALIDHHLPGMEGVVLGEYLRNNNPDMAVALVTGAGDNRLARRTRALSISFIEKPFDNAVIRGLIEDYVAAAEQRERRRLAREDADYAPPIARYAGELGASFAVRGVPERVASTLVETIKRCLNDLRSVGRYTEHSRVLALSGLLTARVLDLTLPRTPTGRTLYEEYDALMDQHGRRREFSGAEGASERAGAIV